MQEWYTYTYRVDSLLLICGQLLAVLGAHFFMYIRKAPKINLESGLQSNLMAQSMDNTLHLLNSNGPRGRLKQSSMAKGRHRKLLFVKHFLFHSLTLSFSFCTGVAISMAKNSSVFILPTHKGTKQIFHRRRLEQIFIQVQVYLIAISSSECCRLV